MIVVEHILRSLVDQMPNIQYTSASNQSLSLKIKFGWGDKVELNKYLNASTQNGTNAYPLIWLILPEREVHKDNQTIVERPCKFVLATTETRSDILNPTRYVGTFDQVLIPMTKYLIQGLEAAKVITVVGDIGIDKRPNYSESLNKDKSGAIDKWDAIAFDCRLEFITGCLNNIVWQPIN